MPTVQEFTLPHTDALTEFLGELTELSAKHGIGLDGMITAFVMEGDDYERRYRFDANDTIEFA